MGGWELGAQQSGLAWSHLVGTFAGLSTAAGHFGLLWPREGGCEPPGEEMGVRGSCDAFLSHIKGAGGRRGVISVGLGESTTRTVSSAADKSGDLSKQARYNNGISSFAPSAGETSCW